MNPNRMVGAGESDDLLARRTAQQSWSRWAPFSGDHHEQRCRERCRELGRFEALLAEIGLRRRARLRPARCRPLTGVTAMIELALASTPCDGRSARVDAVLD
jgi:hypothetical protein